MTYSTSTLAISSFFSIMENPVSWSFRQDRNNTTKLQWFFLLGFFEGVFFVCLFGFF